MKTKPLTVSLVIPVYNEARYLGACLDSIAAQTDPPDEVMVVDNNSRDDTAKIAARYPFVTLLHEKRQGLIPARNTGFAAAKGDILGRINGFVVLSPDWVARVRADFAADPKLGGLGGLGITRTLPLLPDGRFWSQLYYWWTEAYFRLPLMWGATMAIRRTAWQEIKAQACLDGHVVHEDQDLSLLLSAHHWRVGRDRGVLVCTKGQDYNNWPQFSEYMSRRWRTKHHHQALGTYAAAGKLVRPWWRSFLTYAALTIPGGPFIVISFLVGLPGMAWRAARQRFKNTK